MTTVAPDHNPVLDRLPFLSRLEPPLRELVGRLFQTRTFAFGDTIVAEGEAPDGMYVLESGSARVLVVHDDKEITLSRLQPGDWFGETALLDRTTRTATVRASEPVSALWLDRVVFDALLELHPDIRLAFGDQTRVEMLHRFLRTHAAFEDLSLEAASAMYSELRPLEVAAGTVLVREGEPGGTMYLVEQGRLEAITKAEAGQRSIGFMRIGDIFGERSLVTGEPCVATVRAVSDARLLALDRDAFRGLADRFPAFARRVNEQAAGRNYLEDARVPLDFAKEILPGGISEAAPAISLETLEPDPSAQGRKRGRRPRRFPIIQQVDETDCGVACLAMIAGWHGLDVSISWLREVAGTDQSGTTLRALAVTGRRIGLDVEPVKVSRDRLDELSLPAILHWDSEHWVVLVQADERRVEIADPALGLQRMDRAELDRHWDGYAARITPTGTTPEVPTGAPHLAWLLPFLVKHRRALVAALVLALVAAACEVALPLVVEHVVNSVIARSSTSSVEILGLAMLGLAVGGTVAVLFQRLVLVRASAAFDIDTLDFVTTRLLGLPMSYFATRRIGDIERRLSGVREIRRIVIEQGIESLSAATQVIVGIVIMFVLSPLLALLFLLAAPVYALAMRFASNRLRPLYASIEHSFGKYESDQIDLLKGIETVKSTGTEDGLRHRLQRAFTDLTGRTVDSYRTIAAFGSVVQLISLVMYALFVTLAALEVKPSGLSVGGFVAFTVLVLMVTGPLVTLLNIWDDVQVSTVLLNRIADVLDHEPEQGSDRSDLLAVPTLEGRVQLHDVGYHPPEATEPILAGISLDVQPGTTVAIVGRSGSGKSTLLRLLAGLIEPTSGTILFDRTDSRHLLYGDLRRQVGFVLQASYVFAATIGDNIALGDDTPDPDAVRWASEVADLAELVERLPLGYDTPVGDRGLPLSGGQAQRLAIARALYRKPPVLLFDEATSALDTESEAIVKRNIDRLLEGRTAFVVAHRLSTIRNADVIAVLERGRLVEQGSHDELLARKGVYFYLYTQQLSDT
ncbi:MAG TPA: peptidase domain-containing ABC transporter [Acidimicrobiales bacterium]|nr:peptidase domain-containing ABC transporter [Acidimicrobiales bacterium]